MPLLSAAISDMPTGNHAMRRPATRNASAEVCRRENTAPTTASAARYATTMTRSSDVKDEAMQGGR